MWDMKSILTAFLAVCFCLPLLGDEKSDKEIFESTKARAEKGDAEAQCILGVMYDYGKGVLEDDKEAVKWYRKAAEQGIVRAQFFLGVMYDYGEGVLEDRVAAYAWYNIGAANGGETAKSNKAKLAKTMTPEQIAQAQALSKEMLKKNPKLLK